MGTFKQNASVVVTSINSPTPGVEKIALMCKERNWSLIVIGDKKSPREYLLSGSEFYSVEDQENLSFELSRVIPYNTYSRKMLGYLIAAKNLVNFIIETDDDNIPYENFLDLPQSGVSFRTYPEIEGWLNCYKFFTEEEIWPRGFPLNHISESREHQAKASERVVQGKRYIQQALADGDPDVDAIYRLAIQSETPIMFMDKIPLLIRPNQVSPFNSQATTWPIELLILMYLPVTCSFRMTDIWRSYICQRILQNLDYDLVVIGPRLLQVRNAHDLMKDFSEEIEGYLGYERFQDVLANVMIGGKFESIGDDLKLLYHALIEHGFFKVEEMKYLSSWLGDVESITTLGQNL